MVEDETWVNQGDLVFRLDNEQVDNRIADLLVNLTTKQHEIDLRRFERDFAQIEEKQRHYNAQRDLEILQANFYDINDRLVVVIV